MKKLFFLLVAVFSIVAAQAQKPEGLFINSKAPEFKLKDQTGVDISLKELRKKGPVVVLFYRGAWSHLSHFARQGHETIHRIPGCI
ncbi:MAG: redoxin domain-containing protein [Chitinophagaceae bacterium]|nr:MAG: redoxin domain-containing protein [Chitinophagaceae bacterium]